MRALALLLLLCLPLGAHANDWQALDAPGAVALMRHALAPGMSDPAGFTLGDCATQRNLDARGRAQARAIGAALRARGIRFDRVYTSQWCRCRDTAALLSAGPVEAAPALNSFYADFTREAASTAALRALIAATSGRRLFVTHQVNISALTGRAPRSGEVLIVRMTETGTELLGRILIAP